jgi:hypothetical protein
MCSVSGEEKRDTLFLHTSLILRKGRHACIMHVSYLRKRRRVIWGRVSHLDMCNVQPERRHVEHKLLSIFEAF